MPLDDYEKKRDFSSTPEPESATGKHADNHFVVQKHDASHLHYDLRIQIGEVLISWAVPKGPSVDPSVKRLAIRTEDHPMEYRNFEGVIPEAQYGGGTVMIWDEGVVKWPDREETAPDKEEIAPEEMLSKGQLVFELVGTKLKGRFRIIKSFRTVKSRLGKQENAWLLIKGKDEFAASEDILTAEPNSARTGRSLEQIAEEM